MKIKVKRLFCSLMSIVMLLSLFATTAFAARTTEVTDEQYWSYSADYNIPEDADAETIETIVSNATNTVREDFENTFTSITPGTSYTIPLPDKVTITDIDAGLIITLNSIEYSFYDQWEWEDRLERATISDLDERTVTAPVGAGYVWIKYYWRVSASSSADVTNQIVPDLGRVVKQGAKTLTAGENDVYVVNGKDDVTVGYTLQMDMEKLGGKFFGQQSWDYLRMYKQYITDDTIVYLHFKPDANILWNASAFENTTLDSNMFRMDHVEVTENKVTIVCHWDSAKAMAADKLDPMITLNGLVLDISNEWTGDSVTLSSEGWVDGDVYADLRDTGITTQIEHMTIDGGRATDSFTLTLNEKTSKPGMDKTIVLENGSKVDSTSAAAGDTVKFELTSTVPEDLKDHITFPTEGPSVYSIGNSKTYTLTIHDKMNAALKLDETSFQVKVGGTELDPQYYTVLTDAKDITDGCTFEVKIYLDKMYNGDVIDEKDLGVTPITVTYTATLASDAAAGTYENTAWTNESTKDTVKVNTYGIKIFKYDQADSTKGLAGAEFELRDSDGKVIGDTLISDADGYVTIDGLDEGTYTLTETKAPNGYVKSDTPLTIVIPNNTDSTNIANVKFANTKIPSTGGMGTTLFTVGGGVLIAAAGALLVLSRKKKENG